MIVQKICPLMAAIKKNPNLISKNTEKVVSNVSANTTRTKAIGEEAAKTDAWWRYEYREAKKVEEAIKNGTYNPETPEIYNDSGGLNLRYFLTQE